MNETLIKMGQRAQAAEQELMLLDTAAKNQALKKQSSRPISLICSRPLICPRNLPIGC